MKKIFILLALSLVVLLPIPVFSGFDGANISDATPSVTYAIRLTDDAPMQSQSSSFNAGLVLTDRYPDRDWAANYIKLDELWALSAGNPEVVIAVLDTGIDKNHEDLVGRVVAEINFTASSTTDDLYGHGTHIAGIIAANNNNIGITGVAYNAKLLNVKVADDSGHCQVEQLAAGIVWAVDMGADIINISIQIKENSPELEKAIAYAWDRGIIIVAAAGNNVSQSLVYPAAYEAVISVAASNQDGNLAPLSNYGEWVDLAAPGYNIYSLLPNNNYGYETGTSFATAYISGIAALLVGQVIDLNNSGSNNDEIVSIIRSGYTVTAETRITGVIDTTLILNQLVSLP